MCDEEYKILASKIKNLFKKAMKIYDIEDYKYLDDWTNDVIENIDKLISEILKEKRNKGYNDNDLKEIEIIIKKEIDGYIEKVKKGEDLD